MDTNESNQFMCDHELVYYNQLKKGQGGRFKREEDIAVQAKTLAKKILKKRHKVSAEECPLHMTLPIALGDQDEPDRGSGAVEEKSVHAEQPRFPHSAFCQLSSSSSNVSDMSINDVEYDELILPHIQQPKDKETLVIIEESVQPMTQKQKYPLTSKALLARTAHQRQQDQLENRILQLDVERKMVSVFRLKECMKKTEASLGCHTYERNLRAESALQWEQLGFSERVDVTRLGKHKEAILAKYRKLYKEKDDNRKKRLKRKLQIIEKLLKEERIKHGLKNAGLVKMPKQTEIKKVEVHATSLLLQEEIQPELEQEEENICEAEEENIVPLEILENDDNQRMSVKEKHKHEKKNKKDKKDKKGGKKSSAKTPKRGKSSDKSKSTKPKKGGSKKEKRKLSKDASAISQDIVEPLEVYESQFPGLLKLFEEWKEQRNIFAAPVELSEETGIEWKPEIIIFKDFKPQFVYKQRLHLVNVSFQKLHCRLAEVLMDDDLNSEVLQAGPVDAVRLGPGMSWSVDVRLYPVESAQEVTGSIKFITTHLDTTQRQFLVRFFASPCRAEPYIQPLNLKFPKTVFWSTSPVTKFVKVINNGGLGCRMTIRKYKDEDEVVSSNVSVPSIKLEENNVHINQSETEAHEIDITEVKEKLSSEVVTNIEEDSKIQDNLLSHLESSPCLMFVKQIVGEVFDNVFSIFRIQSCYNSYLPAHEEISIPVKFIPSLLPYVGKVCEKYEAIFDGENVLNSKQDLLLFGETEDSPFHVSPLVLDMKLCYIGGNVHQESFTVFSTARHATSLSIKLPPSLAKHVQVDPKEAVLQSNNAINFLVRVILRGNIRSDGELCFDESTGILEFPIYIYCHGLHSENPPPLIVTAIALVSSPCSLSIKPSYTDFGQVSTFETVTAELELFSHSLGIQEFKFINVPTSINIEPGGGSGKILPGEKLNLQVFYSPSLKDVCKKSCSVGCEGQHNFILQCASAIGLANGIQRHCGLHQMKPTSKSFADLKKSFLSDVKMSVSEEDLQYCSMKSSSLLNTDTNLNDTEVKNTKLDKDRFNSTDQINNEFKEHPHSELKNDSYKIKSEKDSLNSIEPIQNEFIEEQSGSELKHNSSKIKSEIVEELITDISHIPVKQLIEQIITEENRSSDYSIPWNIYDNFEIGTISSEDNLEFKEYSELENNLKKNNIMEIQQNLDTAVESFQNVEVKEELENETIIYESMESSLIKKTLSSNQIENIEHQENNELVEIKSDGSSSSVKMLVATQSKSDYAEDENTLKYILNSPVVQCSAFVVDSLLELSAQKIIFPPTPCESFFISHIYLRSRKQEGCHCGLLQPNAHKFIARFEFKSNCNQISVEPRKGEISIGQSIKIAVVCKPKLRKEAVLIKAKELKTEKLYEEAIKAFVESAKNKPKNKKKGKPDKQNKSKTKMSVTTGKLKKKEKGSNEKSVTKSKDKKGRKSSINKKNDKRSSRKSVKSKGSKANYDSEGYTDIEEITLPDIFIDPNTITLDEEDIKAAETYLLKYYDPNTIKEKIVCLVETSVNNLEKRLEVLECEVICPIVPPNIVVQASPCLDFGATAIGTRATQSIPVMNIAENTVPVILTKLNPDEVFTCPVKSKKSFHMDIKERFEVKLDPEHCLNLPVIFTPTTEKQVNEFFEVRSESTLIHITTRGRGVYPQFEFTPEFALYTLEAAPGKKAECKITVSNSCEAALNFHAKQVFIKEGSALPESKPSTDYPLKKTGKQPKKKEKLQKVNTTITQDISDWLTNQFQPINEDVLNPLFTISDNILVSPEGQYVLKITFSPPSIAGNLTPRTSRKSKGKASADKKEKKTKESPKKDKKGSKKGKSKSKSMTLTKTKIFAVKYVISLSNLIDVREWVIVGIVKGK